MQESKESLTSGVTGKYLLALIKVYVTKRLRKASISLCDETILYTRIF